MATYYAQDFFFYDHHHIIILQQAKYETLPYILHTEVFILTVYAAGHVQWLACHHKVQNMLSNMYI